MGFYQDQIVPLLINLTMRRRDLAAYRNRVVPAADGRVLEIGIGSGLNLPFYSRNVKGLIGLEPSPKLLSMVRRNLGSDTPWPELIEGSAEAIPLETHSIDTVVHSRRCACGSRNASRAQVDRAATVYRTWSRRISPHSPLDLMSEPEQAKVLLEIYQKMKTAVLLQ